MNNKSILTNDDNNLRLFEDGVAINKDLMKWRRAEAGMETTTKPESEYFNNNNFNDNSTPFTIDIPATSGSEESSSTDVDRNIDIMPSWLGLYKTPYGIDFDELAQANIKELTKLLVEKKVKYVMGGYGSFGSTVSNNTIYVGENEKLYEPVSAERVSFWKRLFTKKIKAKKEKEPAPEFDALKFFYLVKTTSKESANTYRDRVSNYLKALHNSIVTGQTALQEELLRNLVANKYESLLYAEGLYYVIEEATIVDFIKKSEKGIALDYIKNFTRPVPQEVVDKIEKVNDLEIFDNYVVLHYDPDKKSYKETEQEKAKRRDPIVFGVIAGSRKLYYITDWIDDFCDLTLDKFVDTLNIKKDDLKME